MKRFKFLEDNVNSEYEEEYLGFDVGVEEQNVYEYGELSASWMWTRDMIISQPYEIQTITCLGIGDFLSQFPNHFIVAINSISSNGVEVTRDINHDNIWPWDIHTDPLTIEYLEFIN